MPGVEWGPKNVPREKRLLREVTRFFGPYLQNIDTGFAEWLQTHPELSRVQIVGCLAKTEKEANRIQLGLDVLNQLRVVDRNGKDVRTVVVREDISSTIQNGPGRHHYYYEIDWINKPDEKPVPPPVSVKPRAEKPVYPFTTQAEREAKRAASQRRRQSQLERRWEEERIQAERTAIGEVVIDRGRELGEECMKGGVIRVELGDDGIAVISRSTPFGNERVDRQNGKFGERLPSMRLRHDVLAYVEVLAQKLEGSEVDEYSPNQLDPTVIEDTYERAIQHRMIIVKPNPHGGIEFYYSFLSPSPFVSNYQRIDLNRGVIENKGLFREERPIRPQFIEFLRQKKAELEEALVKS